MIILGLGKAFFQWQQVLVLQWNIAAISKVYNEFFCCRLSHQSAEKITECISETLEIGFYPQQPQWRRQKF